MIKYSKCITECFSKLLIIPLVLLIFNTSLPCEYNKQKISDEKLHAFLIEQKTVSPVGFSRESLWLIVEKTLKDLDFPLYRFSREDGVIYSRIFMPFLQDPPYGSRFGISQPNRMKGDKYYLILNFGKGKNEYIHLSCLVAKANSFAFDRVGKRILNRFLAQLDLNLEK